MELLQFEIGPASKNFAVNGKIMFQHVVAPAHGAAVVTELSNNMFSEKCIERYDPCK